MPSSVTGTPTNGEPRQHQHPVTAAQWDAIERDPEFRALIAAKRRFILPATVFFLVYYFALPVLVGYFPGLMSVRVVGKINLAYLFALSQFFMAWTVMVLYIVKARDFDARAAKIVAKVQGGLS